MALKLADVVKSGGSRLPQRWLLHAGPGWGKTSFAAFAPKPLFVQSKGETGVETLQDFGMIPETQHFPEAQSWEEILDYLGMVLRDKHGHRTLVLDTLNGVAGLGQQFILKKDFGGSVFEFMNYGRGWDAVQTEWDRELLPRLSEIRARRGMSILLLCHSRIKTFNNPTGSNYDRFTPDMNERLFQSTFRWVDGVLFGQLSTQLVGRAAQKGDVNQKAKVEAVVGERRIYTEETAAYTAKNRHGLPPIILGGKSAQDTWTAFRMALEAGRRKVEEAKPSETPAAEPANTESESNPEPVEV